MPDAYSMKVWSHPSAASASRSGFEVLVSGGWEPAVTDHDQSGLSRTPEIVTLTRTLVALQT